MNKDEISILLCFPIKFSVFIFLQLLFVLTCAQTDFNSITSLSYQPLNSLKAILILNPHSCSTCNIPIYHIIDYFKEKKIPTKIITDSELKPSALSLFIQQNNIDTSYASVLTSNDQFLKNLTDNTLILFKDEDIIYQTPLHKINFQKLEKRIEKHKIYHIDYAILPFQHSYHNNLFLKSTTICPKTNEILGIIPSISYFFNYNAKTNTLKEKLVPFDTTLYFNLCKKLLTPSVQKKNLYILTNELHLKIPPVSPIVFLYSFNVNSYYLLCDLEYYSDTIFQHQSAISSVVHSFLLKMDSSFNVLDTLVFQKNYLIISPTGGCAINDSIFYFVRYNPNLKKYTLSKFKSNNKELFLISDIEIPYRSKDARNIVPILKAIYNNELLLFFYPQTIFNRSHTKIFKYTVHSNKIEQLLYKKNNFISYTMFYPLHPNNYIYLTNKKGQIFIEKYNVFTHQFKHLLHIKNRFPNTNTQDTSFDKDVYYFFLENNNILKLHLFW